MTKQCLNFFMHPTISFSGAITASPWLIELHCYNATHNVTHTQTQSPWHCSWAQIITSELESPGRSIYSQLIKVSTHPHHCSFTLKSTRNNEQEFILLLSVQKLTASGVNRKPSKVSSFLVWTVYMGNNGRLIGPSHLCHWGPCWKKQY